MSGVTWPPMKSLISYGVIKLVSEGPVQYMQVDHGPYVNGVSIGLRDKLAFAGVFGQASVPPDDSKAITVFHRGNKSSGAVVGVLHPPSRPTDLAQGDSCLYDLRGRRVWLAGDGIIVDGAGGPVTVRNATTVRLECDRLEVTGDIVDRCDGNDVTVKALRDAYNVHKHTGVQSGGSLTGVTDHEAT